MKNRKGLFALSALSASLLLGVPSVHAADWKPGVPRTVYVNLFEWSWDDIAKECTNYLGPKGYKAVQVSPPQEHEQGNNEWWRRYQPASYKIESRSGNRQQFQNMVSTCKTAGVDIYADAVINHMAAQGGTGIAGSSWSSRSFPAVPYSSQDFHSPCDISGADYNNIGSRSNVLNCSMPGLPDLNTGSDYVRGKIADYLKDLQGLGVAGFRVDAAKHMHEDDVAGIFAKVPGDYFVTLEIIANATGSTPYSIVNNYLQNGRTTNEFAFKALVKETFLKQNGKNIANIQSTWNSWEKVASNKATVFVNNHDEERQGCNGLSNCNSMNNYNGQQYWLANVFMLANDYGYPQVMSGYNFSSHDQGRPNGGPYNGSNTPDGCSSNPSEMGKWNCTHRSNYVGNMVGFRNYVDGTAVANWQVDGTDRIAFSRGNKGFVAINNTGNQWVATLNTGLAEGSYCNVIKGELNGSTCASDKITVNSAGQASINVAANDAIAIHIGQKEGGACTTNCGDTEVPSAPGRPTASVTVSSVALNWTASTDNVAVTGYDIYRNGSLVGSSTSTSYTDSNVPSGTHSYTIKAKDAAGNTSVASLAGSATVNGGSTTTATVYYNQTAKGWSTVNIHYRVGTAAWTAVPGEAMADGCTVGSITYKKKAIDIGTSQLEAVFNNGSSWDNQGNTSGSNYLIGTGVTIVNGNGTMTANATDPCGPAPDTTAPTVPGQPTATVTGSSVALSWAASTDNVGVTSYDVYRGTTLVGSSTTTSYTDSNLPAGTYSYTIKAKDAAGNVSAASPAGSATINDTTDTIADKMAFGRNTNVALSSVQTSALVTISGLSAGTSVPLSITSSNGTGKYSKNGGAYTNAASTIKNGDTLRLQVTSSNQANTLNGAWVKVGDTALADGAFGVVTSAGTTDTIADKMAFGRNTNVAFSSVQTSALVTISGLSAGTSVPLSITSSNGTGKYSKNGGAYTNAASTIKNGDTLRLQVTSSNQANTLIGAWVKVGDTALADGSFGVETSSGTTDTTPPSVPTNLSIGTKTTSSLALSWSASTDASGVKDYDVYRDAVKVATVTGTSYTDTGLTADTTYSYQVLARDNSTAQNVSAKSAAVSGKTDANPVACNRPATLGAIYTPTATTFKLWSPDSSNVVVVVDGQSYPMTLQADVDGYTQVYGATVSGDLNLKKYHFKVNGLYTRDPYGVMVDANNTTNQPDNVVMNLCDTDLTSGWSARPAMVQREDAIIYEVHVRDFTIDASSGVDAAKRGKYAGMTQAGTTLNASGSVKTGIDHLKELGVTHVQLLPVYDFGSCSPMMIQDPTNTNPDPNPYPSDLCYNWGYDPVNYNVPEERYSMNKADHVARVREFKTMVDEFHKAGIRVVMDVVYNHSYTKDMFKNISGKYYTATDLSGTGNSTDVKQAMVARMIRDSLDYWVREYNIDGFRFDLIGIFDTSVVGDWGSYINNKYPDRNILMYGEPWNGYATDPAEADRVRLGSIGTIVNSHVGVFNPKYRDSLKGSGDGKENAGFVYNAGASWGTGQWANNGAILGPISVGMYGSLRYANAGGKLADAWDSMFALDPEQSINYVDAHDNLCLNDKVEYWAQNNNAGASSAYKERIQRFAIGSVLVAQGIPFLHGGSEMKRTKNMDHNSYRSPDTANSYKWGWKSTNANMNAMVSKLIAMRKAHPGFRMTTWQQVRDNVKSNQMSTSLVVTEINGSAVGDSWSKIVVIQNSSGDATVSLPSGNWTVFLEDDNPNTMTRTVSGSILAKGTALTILYQ